MGRAPRSVQDAELGTRCDRRMMTCDFPVSGQAIVLVDDLVRRDDFARARECLRAEARSFSRHSLRTLIDDSIRGLRRQEIWLEDMVADAHREAPSFMCMGIEMGHVS